MGSSRLRKAKPQDDACGVRWDPHGFEKRILRMTKAEPDGIHMASNQRRDGLLVITEH